MAVSRWSTSAAAVVMAVSQLPRGCVLCAKKFALLGLMVGVSAKKFAQRTKNGPQSAFYGTLGELFRGRAAEGAVLGEVFRGTAAERSVLGKLLRVYRHGSRVSQVMWRPTCRKSWGLCSIRSWLSVCHRRVAPVMMQIPRLVAVSLLLEAA